jgi:predicted HicB family RNase H-like nuclease
MHLSTQHDAEGRGDAGSKRDTRLNIRVSEELLARLHAAAKAEGISLSSWVKRILTLALREQEQQRQPRS